MPWYNPASPPVVLPVSDVMITDVLLIAKVPVCTVCARPPHASTARNLEQDLVACTREETRGPFSLPLASLCSHVL